MEVKMSKSIGSKGLALIKKSEGCKLTAYKDATGVLTIGYGHIAGVTNGMTITQAQADAYLKADCQKFADYVDNVAYVPITKSLNDNQRDALISFAFNLGQGNLKKVCAGRTASQIATAMPQYCNAGGKKLAGLVTRRANEVALFNTPCVGVTSTVSAASVNIGDEWVRRLQKAIGAGVDGRAGKETLSKCPTLRKGMYKNTVVGLLQERLGNVYKIGVTGGYDCNFGTGTYNAVVEFQRQKGLTKDGCVGQNTWKKILGL